MSEDLRNRLIDRLLKIVSVAGVVGYLPSLWLSIEANLWWLAAIDTVALAVLIALALVPRVPFGVKIVILLVLTYSLGLALLIWTGPFGAGHLFLFAFVFISVIFYPRWGLYLANALSIATHAAFVAASVAGVLPWPQGWESMVVISANSILISVILTGAAQYLIGGYNQAAREERRLREVTEILLGEIEHRVKNNLQVISSLVAVRARTAPTAEEALIQIRESLAALSSIQHLLYSRDFHYQVQVSDLLQSLMERFQVVHRSLAFTFTWSGPPLEIGADQAAPLGLLVNEVVMNSVRHAFGDLAGAPGKIWLQAHFDEESRRLKGEMGDNGRGMQGSPEGGGSKIIRALAQQLGAILTRKNEPQGVVYQFEWEVPKTRQSSSMVNGLANLQKPSDPR